MRSTSWDPRRATCATMVSRRRLNRFLARQCLLALLRHSGVGGNRKNGGPPSALVNAATRTAVCVIQTTIRSSPLRCRATAAAAAARPRYAG